MPLLLLVFALVSLIPAVAIVDGLIEGEVKLLKGGAYSRANEPGWFWGAIAIYGGMIAWIAYLAVQLVLSD